MDVLIIDDKQEITDLLSEIVREDCDYSVVVAHSAAVALLQLAQKPKVVILDIWLEGSQMDGLGLLRIIKEKLPMTQVIMISGHGTIEVAVKTIKWGAYDFIEKPFKTAKLILIIKRAMEKYELLFSKLSLWHDPEAIKIVGSHKLVAKLRLAITEAAAKDSRVLLTGEQGVGKTYVANAIHAHSLRSNNFFYYWQVCNKSAEVLHDELYGKGDSGISVFEAANGGSLFINELLALPQSTQQEFSSILQSGKVPNLADKTFSVRVMTATKGDPEEAVKQKTLDANLYFSLNITRINVPSLREMRRDIHVLAEHFIQLMTRKTSCKQREVDHEALSAMMLYEWPGNIRQLKNAVEEMMISAEINGDDALTFDLLPGAIKAKRALLAGDEEILNKPIKEARRIFEKSYIDYQVQKFHGNISKTADFMEMDRAALHRKIKNLNEPETA